MYRLHHFERDLKKKDRQKYVTTAYLFKTQNMSVLDVNMDNECKFQST